ncbi:methyl-accepting chemotaxis sensory transducer with Pas/Pac sensor [Oryzisolibacter propanilivorax]|uniref:Methyl-accepting chemotaxis sensory transducer with Pas/Pac sensor n=2 Tax=Oryzisolibacter propanilivorax TaxID=1527607 RepID=A0A1G9QH87_9BURK|nr:methyl-accepting chemotaxis sensory transducer with Pas/Pac sensor [Oryzisolibacter propanilivorax]
MLRAIDRSTAALQLDLQGHIVHANARFSELIGHPAQALRGQPHAVVCPPGYTDSAAYRDVMRRLQAGESFTGQVQRRHADGRLLWLRATYSPVLDRAGQVTRLVELSQDVTEQVNARLQATGLLQAIERSMAVIEFDLDGQVLRANENFLQTLGYAEAEVLGRHHRLFCPPQLAAGAEYAQFWQRLRAGQFFRGQVERVDRHGRTVWLEATYNPVHGVQGELIGVVKVATDITERVRQSQARQQGVDTAYGIAVGTQGLAEQSAHTVGTAVQRIQAMAATVEDAAQRGQALARQAQAIGAVLDTIRRVADQTNLLALNAAVEAARAGEAGKGFAVVAGEVRRLAADSRAATGDISQSVRAIQDEVAAVQATLHDGLASVAEGVALAGQALRSMQAIQRDAGEVVQAVQALQGAAQD